MEKLSPEATCKPNPKNPLDPNRHPTDVIHLRIFIVLFAAWFITNCVYLFKGSSDKNMPEESMRELSLLELFVKMIILLPVMLLENGTGLMFWLIISTPIVLLLLLKSLNYAAKFWAAVSVIFLALAMFAGVEQTVVPSTAVELGLWSHNTIHVLYNLTLFVAALYGFYTVTIDRIAELLKKTSQAMFFFQTLALFGFVVLIAVFMVIAFTLASFSNMVNGGAVAIALLSLLGGVYLLVIIFHFATMVISQCISSWYWSQTKVELNGWVILKSIALVIGNHVGSIVFNATMIMPAALSLYVLCKNKFEAPPNSRFLAFAIKAFLLFYAPQFTLIITGTHGVGVHEATKTIYRLFTRSCGLALSFIYVFATILVVFLGLSVIIPLLIAAILFDHKSLIDEENLITEGVVLIFLIVFLVLFLFATVVITALVSGETVIVHTAEEVEEDENYELSQV